MFNKNEKQKEKQKKGWLFWAMLGFYLFRKVKKIKNSHELKDIEHNFKNFLHEENKEIKEYVKDKESLREFTTDSTNIFKDYFLPYSGNNHTPKILRTKSLAIMLFVAFLFKFSLVAYLYFIFPNSGKADVVLIAEILELVNKERNAVEVQSLALNSVLSNSALDKANDIINKDYFAHTSPDGRRPWDWIDRGQYAYALVGENLAMNFTTAESAHRALINSPGHKRNIMNDKYTDIGLAMVSGEIAGKKTNVLVQMFAVRARRVLVKENIADDKIELAIKKNSEIISETKASSNEINVVEKTEKFDEPKVLSEELVKKEILKTKADTFVLASENPSVEIKEKISKLKKNIQTIQHPGDQVLAKATSKEELDYRLAVLSKKEKSLASPMTTIELSDDKHFFFSTTLIHASQYGIAAIISLLIISMLINIFVRFEIQHKPVLFRTTVVLLFVVALLFINFHYLEGGVVTIYMS